MALSQHFALSVRGLLLARPFVAKDFGFESVCVGLLGPLNSVALSVEFHAPVLLGLAVQLLPLVAGGFFLLNSTLLRLGGVDLWHEGGLGIGFQVLCFCHLLFALLVSFALLKNGCDSVLV